MTVLVSEDAYANDTASSRDGTKIGYRQIGHGPGLILVGGTIGTTINFDQLARALAGNFTVYLSERRGRGMSPAEYSSEYSVQRDVEDLDSLITKTDAHFVFGLSSGALITLEASTSVWAIGSTTTGGAFE